jgi:hypothetical protein
LDKKSKVGFGERGLIVGGVFDLFAGAALDDQLRSSRSSMLSGETIAKQYGLVKDNSCCCDNSDVGSRTD